jgi:hypothetical protein
MCHICRSLSSGRDRFRCASGILRGRRSSELCDLERDTASSGGPTTLRPRGRRRRNKRGSCDSGNLCVRRCSGRPDARRPYGRCCPRSVPKSSGILRRCAALSPIRIFACAIDSDGLRRSWRDWMRCTAPEPFGRSRWMRGRRSSSVAMEWGHCYCKVPVDVRSSSVVETRCDWSEGGRLSCAASTWLCSIALASASMCAAGAATVGNIASTWMATTHPYTRRQTPTSRHPAHTRARHARIRLKGARSKLRGARSKLKGARSKLKGAAAN